MLYSETIVIVVWFQGQLVLYIFEVWLQDCIWNLICKPVNFYGGVYFLLHIPLYILNSTDHAQEIIWGIKFQNQSHRVLFF
jgi:hypothetical protein